MWLPLKITIGGWGPKALKRQENSVLTLGDGKGELSLIFAPCMHPINGQKGNKTRLIHPVACMQGQILSARRCSF